MPLEGAAYSLSNIYAHSSPVFDGRSLISTNSLTNSVAKPRIGEKTLRPRLVDEAMMVKPSRKVR